MHMHSSAVSLVGSDFQWQHTTSPPSCYEVVNTPAQLTHLPQQLTSASRSHTPGCCNAFVVLRAGKVFRTAAPLKATAEDVRRLYNDLAIKDLVRQTHSRFWAFGCCSSVNRVASSACDELV
jgi:hypothetical protein